MNDISFLQMIFHGFVNCYRTHNWHQSATYSDMTQLEFNFFATLGQSLGFISKREEDRKDLIWIDPENKKTILYLERENLNQKCLTDATRKLLENLDLDQNNLKSSKFLVGIFGHVTEATLGLIKEKIQKNTEKKLFLIIAFVGECKESADKIKASVITETEIYEHSAIAKLDDAGYWYMHLNKEDSWSCSEIARQNTSSNI